jgi:hypothetical protein
VPWILILADDLSGAADCGVACVDAGLNTVVALKDISDNAGAEVLSVDADTRRMVPEAAAHEVDRLVRKYASNRHALRSPTVERGNFESRCRHISQHRKDLTLPKPVFPNKNGPSQDCPLHSIRRFASRVIGADEVARLQLGVDTHFGPPPRFVLHGSEYREETP